MPKHDRRSFASAVGAGLIVIGLVTWSALANIHDVSRPLVPRLPDPEWFQVIIGAAGLLGLWRTVVFARLAWLESRRSANEAERAANAAHEALADARIGSAEQADRFAKQLEVAVAANTAFADFTRQQLRAYVIAPGLDTSQLADGSTRVQILWKNGGQTAAQRFFTNFSFEYQGAKRPTPLKYSSDPKFLKRRGSLAPGRQMPFGEIIIPAEVIEKLFRKEERLFLSGWAEYYDVFGKDKRWRTEFSYELVVTDQVTEAETAARLDRHFAWENTDEHNGLDGDCLLPPQTT